MITYKYAYDSKSQIVDIESLSTDHSNIALTENYHCIGCGDRLIPKIKGEKRAKHFSHKSKTSKCSKETYLHRLGKDIFFDTYLRCLNEKTPFTIELSYPRICDKYKKLLKKKCNKGWLKKSHDLTLYFDSIRFETKDEDFIPDLLIYNSKNIEENVYIEIAVTHFLSEKKERSSNLIIEIPVESEEDIERFKSCIITEETASFINFDRNPANISDSECDCSKNMFYCLFVYDSGKCIMKHDFLSTLESEHKKRGKSIKYAKIYNHETAGDDAPPEPGIIFVKLVQQAKERGFHIRNCFICRYSGQNWDEFSDSGAYCKFLKKTCNSNNAVDCKYFRLPKD